MKPPVTPLSVPRPGHPWAHFEVQREIARGNMGIVYLAFDTVKQREVALKILIVGHEDREAGERFQREARSLARLSHRAIVRVHNFGVHQGIPFLTMDYVQGTTLQALIDAGKIPPPRAADLLATIARAVDHAHSRGVLHRDLKPANVLVGSDGQPRISDFGLAKLLDQGASSLTREGDIVGTPVFMSPEQILGELRALGPSVDVWALGVMGYVMLTGVLPFHGRTVEAVTREIVHHEPVPLRERCPEIPPELESVIHTALEKNMDERYRSAGELARDLESFLAGRPVLAGTVTWSLRVRRAARFVRLHSMSFAFAGGIGLGLIALSGLVAYQTSSRTSDSAAELWSLFAERRAATARALTQAREALAAHDLGQAAQHTEGAYSELRWAAAFLDRAELMARTGEGAEGAMTRTPEASEVERGLTRDPVLARLREDLWSVGGRSETGLGDLDAETCLVQAFSFGGDLRDLAALVHLAEKRASSPLAERAWRLLQERSSPSAQDPDERARRLRLHAQLAALGAAPAPDDVEALASAPDPVGGAARAALIERLLREGRADTALRWLREDVASGPLSERLSAARVARAAGDYALHRRLLSDVDLSDLLASPALIERGMAALDHGLPRAAWGHFERARFASTPTEPTVASLVARHLVGETGIDAALRAMLQVPRPVTEQVHALHAAVVLDPALDPQLYVRLPEQRTWSAPLRDAWHRLQVARSGDTIAELVGWLGLSSSERVRLQHTPPRDGLGSEVLFAASEALGDPEALALGLVVLLERGRSDVADERLKAWRERDGEETPGLSAVAYAIRAAGSPHVLKTLRREGVREPWGLAEGRAGLAAFAEGVRRGDTAEQLGRLEELTRRALDLAVRVAPMDPRPRVARSWFHLLRLSQGGVTLPGRVREAARLDAAAARFLAPLAPEVVALDAVTKWVLQPERASEFGEDPTVPPLFRQVLRQAPQVLRGEGLADPAGDPLDVLARETLAVLVGASGRGLGGSTWRAQTSAVEALADRVREASESGQLSEELRFRGWLALVSPTRLGTWLAEETLVDGSLLTELESLATIDEGARVARLVEELKRCAVGEGDPQRARWMFERIGWSQPYPGWRVLRAAVELWTGAVGREGLVDLVRWEWQGPLGNVLRDLQRDEATGGVGAEGSLKASPVIQRLFED